MWRAAHGMNYLYQLTPKPNPDVTHSIKKTRGSEWGSKLQRECGRIWWEMGWATGQSKTAASWILQLTFSAFDPEGKRQASSKCSLTKVTTSYYSPDVTTSYTSFFSSSSFFLMIRKSCQNEKRIYVNPCRLTTRLPLCSITAPRRLRHYRKAEAKPSKETLVCSACSDERPLHISFQEGTCPSARSSGIWLYRIIQAGKDSQAFCFKQGHFSAQTRLLRTFSS